MICVNECVCEAQLIKKKKNSQVSVATIRPLFAQNKTPNKEISHKMNTNTQQKKK